jgi:hypothetical protein
LKIKLSILFLITFCFFNGLQFAQKIHWDRISFGATVQYLKTDGDFNKYWGDTFAGGFLANYNLGNSFSLEAGLLGTYLKPKSSVNNLPNFIFLNIPAGLKYSIVIFNNLKFNSFAGIQNHSFIYSGEAAELVEDNDIEHELGLFIQFGIELAVIKNYGIEVNTKIQNIFTSPEQLKIINVGLTVYIY